MSYLKKFFDNFIKYFWQYLFFYTVTISLLGVFDLIVLTELKAMYYSLSSLIALAVVDIRRDLACKQ